MIINLIKILTNKKIYLPFVVLFLGILLAIILTKLRDDPDPEEVKESILKVKTQNAKLENLYVEEIAYGEIRGEKHAIIRAPLGGLIMKTSNSLDNGSFVKKGTFLYQIDPFNFEQKVCFNCINHSSRNICLECLLATFYLMPIFNNRLKIRSAIRAYGPL